jgi:hypothetical protein
MQFNTNVNHNDLVSDCTFLLTGSYNGTLDYEIEDMTRSANSKLNEIVSLIMRADNRWEFDDENFETIPIGKSNLVAGQQDYEVLADDFLNIQEVLVKGSDGNWKVLDPLDRNEGNAQKLTDLEKDSNNGMPIYYDKMGSSIFLYPKPSAAKVTTTLGLKVIFQRTPSYFAIDDTTKEPGFLKTSHRAISLGMAIDYCLANELDNKLERLKREDETMRVAIEGYYANRNKDEQTRMTLNNDDITYIL